MNDSYALSIVNELRTLNANLAQIVSVLRSIENNSR